MQTSAQWRESIARLKKIRGAVILAHYYQLPEIQEAADFVGDSLNLARQAALTQAEVIVFCGVHFMAESAKILSPDKTVLLPAAEAGCPMADMVTAEEIRALKQEHPGAMVVSYVNSSAEVKAESDLCCTSSNALAVVQSIPRDREIIFVPDRNLGTYVAAQTGRDMILWPGCCPIHDQLEKAEVQACQQEHPGARLVVHPECTPDITAMADAVCSTGGILEYVKNSSEREFIIGTEEGFLYTLQKNCPDKKFYIARSGFKCPDMKLVTLPILAACLEKSQYEITVPDVIRGKASQALEKMLAIRP
jgi:quinolinate synthase